MAKTFGGRWTVQRELCPGGQGDTFVVFDQSGSEGDLCVLKRLRNPERIERFRQEIEVALHLNHPGIIRHIDHDLDADRPYLVVEYCTDGTLEDLPPFGPDPAEALTFFLKILRAVEHAHGKQVVHRDLKPANIFVRKNEPVVGDFGICYVAGAPRRTVTTEAVGPRYYMAPELADGRLEGVGPSADVYSLGKVLYWLMSRRIFDREKHRTETWSLNGRRADVPQYRIAELELVMELMDQSIVEDPNLRFSDARHFRAVTERALWRIQRGARPTSRVIHLPCTFCGVGEYQDVADSDRGNAAFGVGEIDRFGIRRVDDSQWLVLWCNRCGHVQQFRRDILFNGDPWGSGAREA